MTEDSELLQAYAETRSQTAFAELVKRRVGLVYSVALRQVGGDTHLAQDVTQRVFADLARKATTLASRPVLSGWLYRSAQFAASDLVRSERRRRAREQENLIMNATLSADGTDPAVDWDKLRPVLDEAMAELGDEDRDAVALRFLEEKPFAEVGRRLAISEEAARKRVSRALDKLHDCLAQRGVTSTTAALALALGNQATAAVPAGLAASVATMALAGAGTWLGPAISFMSMSKLQVGVAGALAAAGAIGCVVQAETQADIRREIAALRVEHQAIARLRSENEQFAAVAAEVEKLRGDDLEFARLSRLVAEAQEAQRSRNEKARLAEVSRVAPDIQAEIARMNREGNKLVEEFKMLSEAAKASSLSSEAKTAAQAAVQQKLEAIKSKQAEIKVFTENARAAGWVPPASGKFKAVPQPGQLPP
ncbi:MAG: sigma-70 family RNA polymerase sigma factor [Opitutaceae bacterium]|nr:sigma-70 family RNA polymerase sigma factor [Opitutaceae bacterium]